MTTVMAARLRQLITFFLLLNFLTLNLGIQPVKAQSVLGLPMPGVQVPPSQIFKPALIKGLVIHPENPLRFDFIIGRSDDPQNAQQIHDESKKLIKYFLAALTVPDNDLWVNLSPYEEDRIISNQLAQTEMGRDLLAQDYLLKQLTATLIDPHQELGDQFWDQVYTKIQNEFGQIDVPLETFNKVWIVPDEAEIYEDQNMAIVVNSRLKVLVETDYLALKENTQQIQSENIDSNNLQDDILRDIIIPEIEREVNEGRHFASLRQIYHSTILATWFKENLKQHLLNQIYSDQNKINGIDLKDKQIKQKIYNQYLKAFQQGVFNYIKEEYNPLTDTLIPRKYFSGGTHFYDLKVKKSASQSVAAASIDIHGDRYVRVALEPDDNNFQDLLKGQAMDQRKTNALPESIDRNEYTALPSEQKQIRTILNDLATTTSRGFKPENLKETTDNFSLMIIEELLNLKDKNPKLLALEIKNLLISRLIRDDDDPENYILDYIVHVLTRDELKESRAYLIADLLNMLLDKRRSIIARQKIFKFLKEIFAVDPTLHKDLAQKLDVEIRRFFRDYQYSHLYLRSLGFDDTIIDAFFEVHPTHRERLVFKEGFLERLISNTEYRSSMNKWDLLQFYIRERFNIDHITQLYRQLLKADQQDVITEFTLDNLQTGIKERDPGVQRHFIFILSTHWLGKNPKKKHVHQLVNIIIDEYDQTDNQSKPYLITSLSRLHSKIKNLNIQKKIANFFFRSLTDRVVLVNFPGSGRIRYELRTRIDYLLYFAEINSREDASEAQKKFAKKIYDHLFNFVETEQSRHSTVVIAEIITKLRRHIELGKPRVIDFFLSKARLDRNPENVDEFTQLAHQAEAPNLIERIKTQLKNKIDIKRQGYFLIQRHKNNEALLAAIIDDEDDMPIEYRLYAFSFYAANFLEHHHNRDERLDEIMAKLGLKAELFLKQFVRPTMENIQTVNDLLDKFMLRDNEAQMYAMATFVAMVHRFPYVNTMGFVYTSHQIENTRMSHLLRTAHAGMAFGDSYIREANEEDRPTLLIQTMAHEIGHNILFFGYGYFVTSIDEEINHEFLTDLMGKILSEDLDMNPQTSATAVEADAHLPQVEDEMHQTTESHEGGRSQWNALEEAFRTSNIKLDLKRIMRFALNLIGEKDKFKSGNQDEYVMGLIEKLTERYYTEPPPTTLPYNPQPITAMNDPYKILSFQGFHQVISATDSIAGIIAFERFGSYPIPGIDPIVDFFDAHRGEFFALDHLAYDIFEIPLERLEAIIDSDDGIKDVVFNEEHYGWGKEAKPGGIDLSSALMNIRDSGKKHEFKTLFIPPDQLINSPLNGLTPIILEITPLAHFPIVQDFVFH